MAHDTIRSFLAIELSESLKNELCFFVQSIQNQFSGFRFSNPKTWHLTLHFLGDVTLEKIEELKARLSKVLPDVKPFSISLEGLGVFPKGKTPRILWIGVNGDADALLGLKKRLDEVLQKMHFEIEKRTYHPHITIARAKEKVSHPFPKLELTFKAQTIDLIRSLTFFRSDLSKEGVEHTPLFTIPFGSSQEPIFQVLS